MRSRLTLCHIVIISALLTALLAAGQTPLEAAIAGKEAALGKLVQATKDLYADRCKCFVQPGQQGTGLCSVPACGNTFSASYGFGCRGDLGTDPALCGDDCQGMIRSIARSTTVIPPGTNFTQASVSNFVCATTSLDTKFLSNKNEDQARSWSYVASIGDGITRVYPGFPQDRSSSGTCGSYDARDRPWFSEATTGPKDIVFLLDVGRSTGLASGTSSTTKLNQVKNTLDQVLRTLGDDDYFSIVTYSGTTATQLGGFSGLTRATATAKATVRAALTSQEATSDGRADYSTAFETALKLFASSTNKANCTSVVVALMDSEPSSSDAAVSATIGVRQSDLAIKANIITYAIDASTNEAAKNLGKQVACANTGYWDQLNLGGTMDHRSNLASYYSFLAFQSGSASAVRWSEPYEDAFGLGRMVTGSQLVVYSDHTQVAVAGLDVTVAELEANGESFDQVVAALRARSSSCVRNSVSDCVLQSLRAKTSQGYTCPAPTTQLDTCISSGALVGYSTGGCPSNSPFATSSNDLNSMLCEKLDTTTRTAANTAVKSTKDVLCCGGFETCPASLWNGTSPPTAAPAGSGVCDKTQAGVTVAVVGDWGTNPSLELTGQIVQQALPKYFVELSKNKFNGQACAFDTVFINGQGQGSLKVVELYEVEINQKRGLVDNNAADNKRTLVVIVQGDSDVVTGIQGRLSQSIPLIVASFTEQWVVDTKIHPSTFQVVPSGRQVAKSLLQATGAFKWDSVAVLYPRQSAYAYEMNVAVNKFFGEVAAGIPAPVVVGQVAMAGGATTLDQAKDALLALAENSPVGIIAFVTPAQYKILRVAQAELALTNSIVSKFYFILPPPCVQVLDDRSVSYNTIFKGKLQIPQAILDTATQSLMEKTALQDLAILLDAFNVAYLALADDNGGSGVVARRQTSSSAATGIVFSTLRGVNFVAGFTGDFAFDPKTQARSDMTAILVYNTQSLLYPVGQWSGAEGFTIKPSQASAIPASPLKMVTVCLMATGACHDIANVDHMVYAFRQAAEKNQFFLDNNVKINTIAMNAGDDAVEGMRRLLADANKCNFITGPGRSVVGFALTPIINAYKVPQIDYSATSTAFVDKVKYPFFSRTVPSDAPVATVYAEVCSAFKWDRVLLVTTQDEYGRGVTESVRREMESQNVDLEDVQTVTPTSSTALDKTNPYLAPLKRIKEELISRIVLALMPISNANAELFLQTALDLELQKTHIFLFGDTLCQVVGNKPSLRYLFVGSICLKPYYNKTMFAQISTEYQVLAGNTQGSGYKASEIARLASERIIQNEILTSGGFDISTCEMSYVDMYSPYAYDAAQVLIDTMQRALGDDSTSLTDGPGLTDLIRATKLYANISKQFEANNGSLTSASSGAVAPTSTTGDLEFQANGDRLGSGFTVNIQQAYPTAVVEFGSWDSKSKLYKVYDDEDLPYGPLRWLDNSTDVPKVTTRSIAFIASQTISTHPGTIVLSLFGFMATIGVFGFCYQHQKLKQDEEPDQHDEMAGVAVPGQYPDRPDNYADTAPTFAMASQ